MCRDSADSPTAYREVFVCSLARTDNASDDLMTLHRLIAFVNRAVVIRVGYAVGYGGDHTQCLYA